MKKTVVITRPEGDYGGASALAEKAEELGLRAFMLPVLRCEPMALAADELRSIRAFIAEGRGWIAFLSPSAVHLFRRLCVEQLGGVAVPLSVQFAVQGNGTADALDACFDRRPDFVPTVFVAEEFGAEFARQVRTPQKVLVPQSADGRDILAPLLRAHGFNVVSAGTYCTREVGLSSEVVSAFEQLGPTTTAIVFMSPSAVRATTNALVAQRSLLEAIPVISVGPITTQVAKEAGLRVAVEATPHSEEGVIEALRGHFHL